MAGLAAELGLRGSVRAVPQRRKPIRRRARGACPDDGLPVTFSIDGRPPSEPRHQTRALSEQIRIVAPPTPTPPPGPRVTANEKSAASRPDDIPSDVPTPSAPAPPPASAPSPTPSAKPREDVADKSPVRTPAPRPTRPDDDAFADDLLNILASHRPDPSSPPVPEPAAEQRIEPGDGLEPAAPLVAAQSHAIFDRLGRQFSMATTYDLGSMALQQRLDQLDQVIDAERDSSTAHDARNQRRDALRRHDEEIDVADVLAAVSPPTLPEPPLRTPVLAVAPTPPTAPGPPPVAPQPARTPAPVRRIVYDLTPVRATAGLSCWAAAAASLVAWRGRLVATAEEVASATGSWAAYAAGRSAREPSDLAHWGLTVGSITEGDVPGFLSALETYGPLWVSTSPPGAHAVVVSAATSDGSPEGTSVSVNDPCAPVAPESASTAGGDASNGESWSSLRALLRAGPGMGLTLAYLTPPS
jgi:hypothetical protein